MIRNRPARLNAALMKGLSLIELMIAMVLGLATVATVGWIYLGTAQTYRTQDAIGRLQENARYAFELITNDLRMAGTTGCSYESSTNVVAGADFVTGTDWYNNLLTLPLTSHEADGTSGARTEFSDELIVLRADVAKEYIVQNHDNSTMLFTTTAAHGIKPGDFVVATNCTNVAVFQASAAAGTSVSHSTSGVTPGNTTGDLGTTFGTGSRLYRLSANTYYVDTNPAGVRSLYRLRAIGGDEVAEELVEGVEDFQVTYGVDTSATADGNADAYLTATQVNSGSWGATTEEDWARVLSVRVSLLMQTVEDNIVPKTQTYSYNGVSGIVAPDRRLRKVFTHVVKLRNR